MNSLLGSMFGGMGLYGSSLEVAAAQQMDLVYAASRQQMANMLSGPGQIIEFEARKSAGINSSWLGLGKPHRRDCLNCGAPWKPTTCDYCQS